MCDVATAGIVAAPRKMSRRARARRHGSCHGPAARRTVMYRDASVVMLEFNELCPALMQRWIEEGRLPNFRRLRSESLVYRTETEEEPPALEPWIQWVNVHSGLSFAEHGVFHLGEAARLMAPPIWDVVGRHGGRSWICGSMNTRGNDPATTLLLPDPWAKDVEPSAPELLDYVRFVRGHVTEHT